MLRYLEQSLQRFPLDPDDTLGEVACLENMSSLITDVSIRLAKLENAVFGEPRDSFDKFDREGRRFGQAIHVASRSASYHG
jgi:hypothetical protein